MWKKLNQDPVFKITLGFILLIICLGLFAPYVAVNNPNEVNISLKYAKPSKAYPCGNDYLGRCIFSRVVYGIRPSVLLVLLTMLITIAIGIIVGLLSGYFKGRVDEFFMRLCDILLAFPAEAMVLASVGVFGVGIKVILITIIALRWPWYARIFRTATMKYTDENFIQYEKAIDNKHSNIVIKHLLPSILPEVVVISSNNISSLILAISSFSFLGLGVQAPNPEWGMMLNAAKNVMLVHPEQLLVPGIFTAAVCVAFAFLGDCIRDAMDMKHSKFGVYNKIRECD